jgi:myo-inositol-1(or 4)-monophosphatase
MTSDPKDAGDDHDLAAAISVARDAAAAGAEYLRTAWATGSGVKSSQGRDVKLRADSEAESLILRIIKERSTLPILSEEGGWIGGAQSGQDLRWIIDPLDGSMNYLRRVPLSCVSVALWRGDEPLVGVIDDFNHDQVFTAIVGSGAWLDGVPIRVTGTRDVRDAVIAIGFPIATDFEPAALAEVVEFVRAYKKVRMFGTAALSLAFVAAGRADAYYERDIKIWDVAAGLALVRAAGGDLHVRPGREPNAITVYAGNGRLPVPPAINAAPSIVSAGRATQTPQQGCTVSSKK